MTPKPTRRSPFPRAFYIANTMEIFERLAWYGFFTLSSLYITSPKAQGGLGFSDQQRGVLQGMIPFMLYLLPVLTGALADHYGFRRMFLLAFGIMCPAYYLLGQVHDFWPFFAVFLLVALGAACFKPVVVGTIGRATDDSNRGLGFGVFYTMVNVGGFLGPLVAGYVRAISWDAVFLMSSLWIAICFIPALFFYKEPAGSASAPDRRSLATLLREVREVLGNGRFVAYLLLMAGFWTVYNQLFTTLPVFIRDFVDTADMVRALRLHAPGLLDFLATVNVEQLAAALPALAEQQGAASLRQLGFELVNYKVMVPEAVLQAGLAELRQGQVSALALARDWATAYRQINPEYIINLDFGAVVLGQIAISAYVQRWRALPVLVAGTLALSLGIALCGLGHLAVVGGFGVATAVLVFTLGEMLASPKSQEYVAAIAPRHKTAMYMGYYFVSMALGNLCGGLLSGWAYTAIAKQAQQPLLMWGLFGLLGALAALGMLVLHARLHAAERAPIKGYADA